MSIESRVQPGIREPVPAQAMYLHYTLHGEPRGALRELASKVNGIRAVVGLGESLVIALGASVPGLRGFIEDPGFQVEIPSTPVDLWIWVRGDDRGELLHCGRSLDGVLAGAFERTGTVHGFRYGSGLDLTGYEDGTENPTGSKAFEVALVGEGAEGMRGSSFVAVQQWVHDMDRFQSFPEPEQDNIIGRRKSDNEELDDAPISAHVKRTAQEDFDPEAFLLRRSMPWADETRMGLVFVAFGRSFDAFEAQLRRMSGAEDGTTDALFRFSQPVTGCYLWCPPLCEGALDLRAVGIE